MISRNTALAVIALGVLSAQMNAEPMVKEVIGDKAPYFFGYVAEDGVYAWKEVKQEVYDSGTEFIAGGKAFSYWVLEQLKERGKPLLRVGYQCAKIGVGVVACRCPIPNALLGMNGHGEVEVVDEHGHIYLEDAGTGRKVLKYAPTRILGLALIWHGLKGLARQCGFNGFGEIYHFVENDEQSDDALAITTKKRTQTRTAKTRSR